jgi:hypothetical protein
VKDKQKQKHLTMNNVMQMKGQKGSSLIFSNITVQVTSA